MYALVEGRGRSEERLQGHRAGDVGESGESLGAVEGERADSGERLGAVEQREPLLGLEAQRLDAGALERLAAGQEFAAVEGFAFADDAEREVGERREVAGRSDASLWRGCRDARRALSIATRVSATTGRAPL